MNLQLKEINMESQKVSILGPLLFTIYLNGVPTQKLSESRNILYADENVLLDKGNTEIV